MEITKKISLPCSSTVVWQWITEFDKIQKWNPTVLQEEILSSGQPGPGFKSKILLKEGKKELWYDSEITDYTPEKSLHMVLRGGNLGSAPMYLDYEIKEEMGKTELTYYNRWQPKGLMMKLLHPMIKKMADKNAGEVMRLLKNHIEKEVTSINS